MTREVRAADGRTWTVRRHINWARPTIAQGFEHDVAAGKRAGIIMLALVGVMLFALVFWALAAQVFLPIWVLLTIITMVLMILVNWAMTRPWSILAFPHDPAAPDADGWGGAVRGFVSSRREEEHVVRCLELNGTPDDGSGILRQLSQDQAT